jgi:hypothetical protein
VTEPTSYQNQIWRVERVFRGQPHLHSSLALRLDGPLDVPRLRRAAVEVQRAHELLRTGFRADGPRLTVMDTAPAVEVDVVPAGPGGADGDRLRALIGECVRPPFPLAGEALFRLSLITDGGRGPVLVLVLHRLICDAASLRLVVADLAAAYDGEALAGGDGYFRLQSARPEQLDADRRYWTGALADYPVVRLGDRPAGDRRPDPKTLQIPAPGLDRALPALRHRHRATSFTLVAAAVLAALAEVTGTADQVLATAFENRLDPRTTRTVGPLAQVMLLRARAADRPFAQVVGEVKDAFRAAVAHQRLPFEEVVELLAGGGVPRDDIAPVVLALEPAPQPWPRLAGLPTAVVGHLDDGEFLVVRPGELDLRVVVDPDAPRVEVTYDGSRSSDDYVRRTVARVLARLLPPAGQPV